MLKKKIVIDIVMSKPEFEALFESYFLSTENRCSPWLPDPAIKMQIW